MEEVTGGARADTVAVDIQALEDGVSQQSPIPLDDDGEEANVREVTHVLDTVAVSMSDDDDDSEEGHIPFRREDLNSIWVSSIKQKNLVEPKILKASSASKSCSIHRVPCWLPKDNSNSYRPQFISIGPYHYKERKCQLRAMEEHKRRYLQGICSRKPEGWLEDCLTTIKRLEKRARNYYSEEGIIDNRLGNEDLVASHFNNMARGTMRYCDEFYLSDVCEKINLYSERSWPKLRASLVHDYFNNPWAIISFLAGVFFLLLAIGQTFFTSFPKFATGK